MKNQQQGDHWAKNEFGSADFGDKRLKARLIKLADRLSESPESPINQACSGWAETKAAYRFFRNESVVPKEILSSHVEQTAMRAKTHKTILAVQDTSYFNYTAHKKTTGLGVISSRPGTNVKKISAHGVIMHTSFALSTQGLPLGILDQKVYPREIVPEELKKLKKRSHNTSVAIKDKESFRWLESLRKTKEAVGNETQIVTICDREADMYEFFELAHLIGSPVLVRVSQQRRVNRASRYSKKTGQNLLSFLENLPCQGNIEVEIPARDGKPQRIATLELRFGSLTLNPPRNHIRHKTEEMPNLKLNAVYVVEKTAPPGTEALEWMLFTDLPVNSFDEAVEKVQWYCLRWRIEVFHKILKSGLHVEHCRLGTADRLVRYLTIMSIIAWRIFWITLLGRSDPTLPCTTLLEEHEWKVLYSKFRQTKRYPKTPPTIRETVRWIAQLGGFLARKGDGDPGTITLWRGWKRLNDLSEGWSLAHAR